MAKPLQTFLGFLSRAVGTLDIAELTDEQLLEQFVRQRDEAAFAQLMRRHGPMVLGVCRRVLAQMPDEAEDAFQAAFLVLARKASSVRKRDSTSSWLHGVAYRTALKARVRWLQRRSHERQAAAMPPSEQLDEVSWRELRAVLDEELDRMPEQYRTVFILCCLEEMTDEEAARQLGCPSGTIRSRLTRARELLRNRLAARGLTLSAAAMATPQNLSAAVPTALFTSTLKAAGLFAAGPASVAGLVSGQAVQLAQVMLGEMLWAKLKLAGVLLAVLAVITTTSGVLLYHISASDATAATTTTLPAAEPAASPSPGPDRQTSIWKQSRTITAHVGAVRALAVAPDQKTVASVSDDHLVRLYDLETGRELRTIRAYHKGPITSLSFSPDSQTLATAADDKLVRFWSVAEGRRVLDERHTGEVAAVVFLANGQFMVTDGERQRMVGGRWYKPPPPGTVLIQQALFSRDGSLLAAAGSDHRIKVWDVAGKQELTICAAHEAAVTALAFSSDQRWLASGSADQSVRVWEACTGQPLVRLDHAGTVQAVAFAPDGTLATAATDGAIRFWQVTDAQAKVVLASPGTVQRLEFTADGSRLVAGCADGQLIVWDAQP